MKQSSFEEQIAKDKRLDTRAGADEHWASATLPYSSPRSFGRNLRTTNHLASNIGVESQIAAFASSIAGIFEVQRYDSSEKVAINCTVISLSLPHHRAPITNNLFEISYSDYFVLGLVSFSLIIISAHERNYLFVNSIRDDSFRRRVNGGDYKSGI